MDSPLPFSSHWKLAEEKVEKKKMEDKWKTLYLLVFLITSQIAHESTDVKGIDWLVKMLEGKVKVVMTSFSKCHT